jgi:hypothetical protein
MKMKMLKQKENKHNKIVRGRGWIVPYHNGASLVDTIQADALAPREQTTHTNKLHEILIQACTFPPSKLEGKRVI